MLQQKIHNILLLVIAFACCLALDFSTCAAEVGEPPAQPLFQRGVKGQVVTADQAVYPLEGITINTPEDLDAPGAPLYQFSARPAPPRFLEIREIVLNPLETNWMGSRPEAMECYWLGEARAPAPAPPNWRRVIGQTPRWNRAVATRETGRLPFLNHAIFCWAPPPPDAGSLPGVYLFRQSFDLNETRRIARATLRVTTNANLIEGSLNEYPLHLADGQPPGSIAVFEVTSLLRPGPNILALKARELQGVPGTDYGLAFHLEWVEREQTRPDPMPDPRSALATGDNGDRLWGRIAQMRGTGVQLETRYGTWGLDWEECTGILFPHGWPVQLQQPGLGEWLQFWKKPSAPPPSTPHAGYALPLATIPQPLQDRLLRTEGRATTAKPQYADAGQLVIEAYGGEKYALPLGEVLGIYPPRPVQRSLRRVAPQATSLYCRVQTVTGETVSGLLRQLNRRRAVVQSASGWFLTIPSKWVATIVFPYHTPAATRTDRPRKGGIAIVGRIEGQEAYEAAWQADALDVQAAAYSIGVKAEILTMENLIDPNRMDPKTQPVLVSVDPVGEYLHTLYEDGDAQKALVWWLDRGGIMVVLSRGGAFRTAVRQRDGRFVRTIAEPSLADRIDVETVRPTTGGALAGALGAVHPFDHPPNTSQHFFFQRTSRLPEGLYALPRRINLAPMISAPFFPMVGRHQQGSVLYYLADMDGGFYGPALTLLPKGRGWVVIVDHLLWESRPDGRPFSETVLPTLLQWTLTCADGR